MRITKVVDFGSGEIEVDIDAGDISAVLSEAFAVVRSDKFDERPDRRAVARALNDVGVFLDSLKDEHIALLGGAVRSTVAQFLQKGAGRFAIDDGSSHG